MIYRSIKPLIVEAVRVKAPMCVATENGEARVDRGDWLIRNGNGSVFVLSDPEFQCTFEKLESYEAIGDRDGKPCGC
jgi:hypothetical protein